MTTSTNVTFLDAVTKVINELTKAYSAVRPLAEQTVAAFTATAPTIFKAHTDTKRATAEDYSQASSVIYAAKMAIKGIVATPTSQAIAAPVPVVNFASTAPKPNKQ